MKDNIPSLILCLKWTKDIFDALSFKAKSRGQEDVASQKQHSFEQRKSAPNKVHISHRPKQKIGEIGEGSRSPRQTYTF